MTSVLNRPNVIARAATLLTLGVCVFVIVLLAGGGSSYALKLELSNAAGLRPGSQVLLGGVAVGSVSSLDLNSQNVVIADLNLDPGLVHVGRGASASVVAANLLGEKYVSLRPGDQSAPLPSGAILPESATNLPTDLDQIVDVLDAPTRADLAVLLNEAGTAVAGRRRDVSAILRQFPLSLTAATRLLTTMVQDNHTLSDLVTNSNQFISRVNEQAPDLKAAIGASAGAVTTLALRSSQLEQTVQRLPALERSFTNTFVEGRRAIIPLVPAASEISAAAPALDQLLRAVGPFTQAAVPTLNRAAAVAPTLSRLATKATPIVRQAVPTTASLDRIAKLAGPLSAWLGLSSHDAFDIFAGWSRAIQFRDGLSHVFNGDVYFSPTVVLNVANQGASATQRCQNLLDVRKTNVLQTMGLLAAANSARLNGCPNPVRAHRRGKRHGTRGHAPILSANPIKGAGNTVSKTLGNVGSTVGKVLGGLGATAGGAVSNLGSTLNQGSGSSQPGSLQHLLDYLISR